MIGHYHRAHMKLAACVDQESYPNPLPYSPSALSSSPPCAHEILVENMNSDYCMGIVILERIVLSLSGSISVIAWRESHSPNISSRAPSSSSSAFHVIYSAVPAVADQVNTLQIAPRTNFTDVIHIHRGHITDATRTHHISGYSSFVEAERVPS